MYTNLYVYKAPRLFMSGKLYWRIKKDGKWTWSPAVMIPIIKPHGSYWAVMDPKLNQVEEE